MAGNTKSAATGIKAIAGITNLQFWDKARRFSPTFKSHTSKGTSETFTEKGYESIRLQDTQILNQFFEISMRIAFQMLNVSRAKNPFVDKGLVAVYDTPNGGFVQRMATQSIKPVSPAYNNLRDGDSVDPFIVRKPELKERFFQMNFDYQNLITIQEFQLKTMWLSEYGIGEFIAGVLEGMANGYTIQEYVNVKNCINTALNSTEHPLQDTQVISVSSWTDANVTDTELVNFVLTVKNVATEFETVPTTKAFNAMKFDSVPEVGDHVLLMRKGIRNLIDVKTLVGAFNPDKLSIPFEIVEVQDFGGLIPLGENNEELQPVYDGFGTVVGFIDAAATINAPAFKNSAGQWIVNITSAGTTADTTFPEEPASYRDPNEDVLAVIMQRGAIFENAQNPYTVTPIFNGRGLYTNYIANRPNNGINYDALYNVIAIRKPQS